MPPTPPRAPGQDPAVRRILRPRPAAAVVKGGADLPGPDAVDVLVQRRPGGGEPSVEVFAAPKIGQERVSGAGRAPASAITAEPAKAASMSDAVRAAKAFATRGIEGRVGGRTPFETVWQGA